MVDAAGGRLTVRSRGWDAFGGRVVERWYISGSSSLFSFVKRRLGGMSEGILIYWLSRLLTWLLFFFSAPLMFAFVRGIVVGKGDEILEGA